MRFLIKLYKTPNIYIITFILLIMIIAHLTVTIKNERNKIPFMISHIYLEKVQNLHVDKKISKEAMNQPIIQDIPTNLEAFESVEVLATGYTAGRESTGKESNHPSYGITYSGVGVVRDSFSTIAADLNVFPLGTILYIPGYGFGVVADIGGAIKGNHIDLYYNSVKDVYNEWGKKYVKIYVIKKGAGSLTEEELKELNSKTAIETLK